MVVSEILDMNMAFVRPKRQKTPIPPRMMRCGKICYCSQDDGKGGLGLRGVAFMAVLAVLESSLSSFCLF